GLLAPLIAPYGQNQLDFTKVYRAPSLSHFMGTDGAGRDVFSRTLYALRLDLGIVAVVTYPPLVVGVLIGAVAGFFGGILDATIARIVDTMIGFPCMVLFIAVIAMRASGVKGTR